MRALLATLHWEAGQPRPAVTVPSSRTPDTKVSTHTIV
jgi:hypothetical protein